MKKLFLAMIGLFVLLPVSAQAWYDGERVTRAWSQLVTFSATNHALDPGFQADWVQFCLHHPAAEAVYVRMGKTLATATTADTGAVTSTTFIAGSSGSIAGRAYVIAGEQGTPSASDNNRPYCRLEPWRTDGLVVHAVNTSTVSLDVTFYETSLRN